MRRSFTAYMTRPAQPPCCCRRPSSWNHITDCYGIGSREVRIMPYEPSNPQERRYEAPHFILTPELRNRITEYCLAIMQSMVYDCNSIEFSVRGGVPYAIDYLNEATDAKLHSVQAENFDWFVEHMAAFLVDQARLGREKHHEYSWSGFLVFKEVYWNWHVLSLACRSQVYSSTTDRRGVTFRRSNNGNTPLSVFRMIGGNPCRPMIVFARNVESNFHCTISRHDAQQVHCPKCRGACEGAVEVRFPDVGLHCSHAHTRRLDTQEIASRSVGLLRHLRRPLEFDVFERCLFLDCGFGTRTLF